MNIDMNLVSNQMLNNSMVQVEVLRDIKIQKRKHRKRRINKNL